MSRSAIPPAPSTPRLAWYFVVVVGPDADRVVAGPYPDEPSRWERKLAEDEYEAPLAAEQLTPDEAEEMEL